MAQRDMVYGLEYVAGLRFVAPADGKDAGCTQLERGPPEGTYILFSSWVIDADLKKTHCATRQTIFIERTSDHPVTSPLPSATNCGASLAMRLV